MAAAQVQGDMSRVEYYAVPTTGAQHPALQVRDTEGDEVCCLLVNFSQLLIT